MSQIFSIAQQNQHIIFTISTLLSKELSLSVTTIIGIGTFGYVIHFSADILPAIECVLIDDNYFSNNVDRQIVCLMAERMMNTVELVSGTVKPAYNDPPEQRPPCYRDQFFMCKIVFSLKLDHTMAKLF